MIIDVGGVDDRATDRTAEIGSAGSRDDAPTVPARLMSMGALRLHAQGLLASFEDRHAGMVSDGYLATTGGDTAFEVLELCLAGVWTRADGGYRVISSEAFRMAGEVHRQMVQNRET